MKKNEEKLSQFMLLGIIIAAIVLLLVLTFLTNHKLPSYDIKERKPDDIQYNEDGSLELKFEIDHSLDKQDSIVFFTNHQLIDVYADNSEIYELKEDNTLWGHTTGNVWNFVEIPENANIITVKSTPCYPEVEGSIREYYIGQESTIYTGILRNAMPPFMVSVTIFLVGIFIISYWLIIYRGGQVDGTLLYLGVFSAIMGLWAANETPVAALIIVNRQLSTFAAYILLMIMPIPFIMFVKDFINIGDEKIWKRLCDLSMFVTIICLVLHFVGGYELKRSIWLIHLVILGGLMYLVVTIILKIVRKQVDKRLRSCIAALCLVVLATVVDMGRYYKMGSNSGMFGRLSFLVFIIALGVESARQTINIVKRGRRVKELEQFALNDSMTGLYNRNAYDYFVNNEKNFLDYMIVTFDLNNLKKCNDNFGHRMGDNYIITSSRIIEEIFEEYGKCYRIGGDEFCCIIPDGTKCQVERLIQKLQQEVAVFNNKKIIPTEVGIACGYALYTTDDISIEKVRARADKMMYVNKKNLKS